MAPLIKIFLTNLIQGAVQHRISTSAGAAVVAATAALPALQSEGQTVIPASIEEAVVQLAGLVIGVALIYFNPKKNNK